MLSSLLRPAVVLAAGVLVAQGCGAPGATPNGTANVPGSGTPVTFAITAPASAFSDREPITVSVWDSAQLAIAEQTAGCTVSKGVNGQETVNCPAGVTYRKPTPETRQITRAELAAGVSFASQTVTVGERYRVTLGGKAADDCNTAGAFVEGVANAATTRLENLDVAQTLMACVSPPPSR
jgi:hypothetical protein